MIQRVLHAGQRLRGIVVLVVNVEVVLLHGLAHLVAEEVVVNERLGGLRSKLHHHSRGRVCVHICIFARDVVALDVDDLEEHLTRLCLASDTALVAVLDIYLGHVFAGALHEFELHKVLDFFHGHLRLASHGDAVCNLMYEVLVFALVGAKHSFADSGNNLLFVETDDASVTFDYCLDHIEV